MATPKEDIKRLYIHPKATLEENEVKQILDIFSKGANRVEKLVYFGQLLSEKETNLR